MDVRVATEYEGALVRVTLSAPPARRLDSAAVRALAAALGQVTDRAKVVLFDGDGDDFALGGDATPGELHALFRRLIALGIPTAAVVRGGCLGPALELAAFCNFVFAARDARFGACPLPAFVLPLKLGQGNAEDLRVPRRRALGRRGLSPRPRARHRAGDARRQAGRCVARGARAQQDRRLAPPRQSRRARRLPSPTATARRRV